MKSPSSDMRIRRTLLQYLKKNINSQEKGQKKEKVLAFLLYKSFNGGFYPTVPSKETDKSF